MGCCKKSFGKKGMFFGNIFALLFVLCFFWYYAVGEDFQKLYMDLHRMSFLWFKGMDFASFVSGLVQAYILGWIVALVIKIACMSCGCCKDEGKMEEKK